MFSPPGFFATRSTEDHVILCTYLCIIFSLFPSRMHISKGWIYFLGQLPQIATNLRLKTTELSSHHSRGQKPKSKRQQGGFRLGTVREGLVHGGCSSLCCSWLIDTSRRPLPPSSQCSFLPCDCVSCSVSHEDTLIGFRARLSLVWSHLYPYLNQSYKDPSSQ